MFQFFCIVCTFCIVFLYICISFNLELFFYCVHTALFYYPAFWQQECANKIIVSVKLQLRRDYLIDANDSRATSARVERQSHEVARQSYRSRVAVVSIAALRRTMSMTMRRSSCLCFGENSSKTLQPVRWSSENATARWWFSSTDTSL